MDAPSPPGGAPIPILLNESAGSGPKAEEVEQEFRTAGLDPRVEIVPPEALSERIRALVGAPRIAVAGGDGSMQTAAAALRGTASVLIPIPAGHLNHFARRLGIDSSAAAAAAAANPTTGTAPIGIVRAGDEERVFLNTAVVGAYPDIIRLRERMRRFIGIWPAATVAGLWVWARWPLFDLVLRSEDFVVRHRTAMLWIGTGAGTFPAPHEAPLPEPGGGLEFVVLPSGRRRNALRLFRSLWARRRGEGPETVGLEVLRSSEVEIDSHHHIQLTLDAEAVTLTAPVRVSLQENCLRVALLPAPV